MQVPGGKRRTDGAAGVAGRRLYPDPVEDPLARKSPVRHAVQGHTAGEAEI